MNLIYPNYMSLSKLIKRRKYTTTKNKSNKINVFSLKNIKKKSEKIFTKIKTILNKIRD